MISAPSKPLKLKLARHILLYRAKLDCMPKDLGNVRICQFMHSIFRFFGDI